MRSFKTNISIILIVNFTIFCSIYVWSILKSNELDDLLLKLNSLSEQSQELEDKILQSKIIKHDLKESILEKERALKLIRSTVNFKESLFNQQDNLISKYHNKSASSINGEINRLLPSLRKRCENASVSLINQNTEDEFSFNGDLDKDNQYGFGFTAYDGFWPNFDKDEANLLGLQSAIIKELIDFITTAANGNSFKLYSIKREAAGPTDKKFIGEDEIDNNQLKIFSDLKNVKSLLFELKFQGRTNQARTLLNQLRPPYCMVSFSSFRKNNDKGMQQNDSFISYSEVDKKSDILPIINDIDSQFTLLVEYVYHIDYNTDELLKILEKQFIDKEVELNLLELLRSEMN